MTTLVLINSPTPYRDPIMNRIFDLGQRIRVVYREGASESHGWGRATLHHPHVIARSPWQASRIALSQLLRGEVGMLVSFGYKGLPYVPALLAARARGIPIVVRNDANVLDARQSSRLRRRWRRFAARTLLPADVTVWTIGTRNAEFWKQELGITRQVRIPYEVPILPGGADPEPKSRSTDEILRIILVGRLVPIKQANQLIQAVLTLPPALEWRLTVVGKGPEREKLKALSARDPRISFPGAIAHQELGIHLANADVLVLPSSQEAWGLVVNEALGFGCRVVVSDAVGAAPDLVTPHVGVVYPSGDVDALRNAILTVSAMTPPEPRNPPQDPAELMAESIATLLGSRDSTA